MSNLSTKDYKKRQLNRNESRLVPTAKPSIITARSKKSNEEEKRSELRGRKGHHWENKVERKRK
jgi:hypothetical protein